MYTCYGKHVEPKGKLEGDGFFFLSCGSRSWLGSNSLSYLIDHHPTEDLCELF